MTSILIDRTDGLSSSTAIKGPCKATTTANIALYGEQTLDGIAVVTGDRVLVKNQTAGYENGIYVVDTGQWRRAKDFSRNNDVREGTQVFVANGTANERSLWCVITNDPIIVGTDTITFLQIIVSAFELETLLAEAEAAAAAAEAAQAAAEAAAAALPPITANTMLVDNAAGTARQSKSFADIRSLLALSIFVDTRTALKALDTTKDVNAYLKEAGREGVFLWKTGDYSAQVAADTLEGIYVKANAIAATAGAWVRVFQSEVNVKWYGAVGDGVADDTAAIAAAIATTRNVYLPKSTYLVTAGLTIATTGQCIRGDGAKASIILNNTASVTVLTFTSSYSGLSDMSIEASAQLTTGQFVLFNSLTRDNFVKNFSMRFPHVGIRIGTANPVITHIVQGEISVGVDATAAGILVEGGNDTFIDRVVLQGASNGNGVQISSSGAVWMTDCDAIAFSVGLRLNPNGGNISWCFFENCAFDTNAAYGLYITGNGSNTIKGLSFSNCWFATNTSGGVAIVDGATSDITGVNFTNCRVFNNGGHGINLQAVNGKINNIVITSSLISGNSQTASNTTDGINAAAVTNLTITGNNSRLMAGFSNTQRYGININGAANNYIVSLNNCSGNATGTISDTGSGGTKVVASNI